MKRTLIQCLHRTGSSTHTRKKHKNRPLSSETNRCPATFEGIYTSVLLIILKLQGFYVQNVITVTCYFRHEIVRVFSGVMLLSLFVADLQNSRLIRVECTFSTIPTCVNSPKECISSAFTIRYYGVLQGHLLSCFSFLHFLAVFGSFLTTDYLFCDLLLGSVSHVS